MPLTVELGVQLATFKVHGQRMGNSYSITGRRQMDTMGGTETVYNCFILKCVSFINTLHNSPILFNFPVPLPYDICENT